MSQRGELLRSARDYITRQGWPVFVLSVVIKDAGLQLQALP